MSIMIAASDSDEGWPLQLGGGSHRSPRYLKQHRPADPYDAGDLLALWYLVTRWDRWN